MNLKACLYYLGRTMSGFGGWKKYYEEIEKGNLGKLGEHYMSALFRHALTMVPYYQSLEVSRRSLKEFPLLNKRIIRKNFEHLQSRDPVSRHWFENSSGGSTGEPQTFIQDRDFTQWSFATETFYYRRFLGTDYASSSKVVLWGSERDIFKTRSLKSRLSNFLSQTTFLNTFKVSEDQLVEYAHIINKKRPAFIKGYAGSLYQLARVVKKKNIRMYQPAFVYSAAETLRPFMRELIQEVFNCRVYDFYGSREVAAIAGECSYGKMHVFSFNNWVEVVDPLGQPVRPGRKGRIIVTTLHNYAMPLIRYEIGDTAKVGSGSCPCGSPLPALEQITGRVTDHFMTANGHLVYGGYFTHLFYFRDWVTEFQVLQEDLDLVKIYYKGDERHQPPMKEIGEINEKIRLVMGKECRIEWHEVEMIPRTPQGKLLFIRSLVWEDR